MYLETSREGRPQAAGPLFRQKGPLREGLCALALSAPALQEGVPQSARPVPRAVWASAGVGHRPRGAAGEAARLHFERATLTPSRGGGQHRSSAATTKLVGILVEACIKLHGCIGCGLNRSIRAAAGSHRRRAAGGGPETAGKELSEVASQRLPGVVKWWSMATLSRAVLWWGCA